MFLDLVNSTADRADFRLLPVAWGGTVSYGSGTAEAPSAILQASRQVELWDDEVGCDLASMTYHTARMIAPVKAEAPAVFLTRLEGAASSLAGENGVTIGVGGEHSITPPLVRAAAGKSELSDVTVVQFDAHADLRDQYDGTEHSHACVMRRLVDAGARVIGIGIRAGCEEEWRLIDSVDTVEIFRAQDLAIDPGIHQTLLGRLRALTGRVYVTIDVDSLDCHLCPGTGTPEPGGLSWWVFLQYLRASLSVSAGRSIIGADVVETVSMSGSQVNEFVAARILGKIVAYLRTPWSA